MLFFDVLGLFYLIGYSLLTGATQPLNWTQLLDNFGDSYLAQRDVAGLIPIDQINVVGISLNEVVFNVLGYIPQALSTLKQILDLRFSVFVLDVYWNQYTKKWQLCPAPLLANMTLDEYRVANISWKGKNYYCQVDMLPTDVFNGVALYLADSNTELYANMVQIALNPKTVFPENSAQSFNNSSSNSLSSWPSVSDFNTSVAATGNSSLADFVVNCLNFLYTPEVLNSSIGIESNNYTGSYGSIYPGRDTFLFKLLCRLMIYILEVPAPTGQNSYNFTTFEDQLFFRAKNNSSFYPLVVLLNDTDVVDSLTEPFNYPYNSSYFSNIAHQTHFRLAFDSNEHPFTTEILSEFAKGGFTPVINSSSNATGTYSPGPLFNDTLVLMLMNETIPYSFWAWEYGQPALSLNGSDLSLRDTRDDNPEWAVYTDSQNAYRCVIATSSGWLVENCYNQFRYACKSTTDPFLWTLSEKIETYFSSSTVDDCPEGFSFGVPYLAIEQFSLITLLNSSNVLYPVWVDMNDIYLSGCFVTGGPYAECPNQKIIDTRNFVKSVAPTFVVSLVIIILIFFHNIFRRVPIQGNRARHWKKAISQYYKENDFEGVPS